MKKLFYVLPLLLLFACGKDSEKESNEELELKDATEISEESNMDVIESDEIYGSYTGAFVASKYKEKTSYTRVNKITIFIDSIRNEILYGHSVVAGNERPFKGNYKIEDYKYIVQGSEPGDDKYDGVFNFTIYDEKITGTWKSYDNNLLVTEREYEIEKRSFSYNPNIELPENVRWALLYNDDSYFQEAEGASGEFLTNDVLKVNASKKLLTKKEIENMHKGDLEIIRNSIYARHGYSFKTRKIRYVFDRYVDWYIPYSTDVRNKLTEIELKNIELLKRYEQHAEAYYDSFGR